MSNNRHDAGMEMLENALVAADLNELDDPQYKLDALKSLIDACFQKLDECFHIEPPHPRHQKEWTDKAAPLVLRYRKAAKAQSEKVGICFSEFNSLYYSARIHQVLSSTPRLDTPCERGTPGKSSGCSHLCRAHAQGMWLVRFLDVENALPHVSQTYGICPSSIHCPSSICPSSIHATCTGVRGTFEAAAAALGHLEPPAPPRLCLGNLEPPNEAAGAPRLAR